MAGRLSIGYPLKPDVSQDEIINTAVCPILTPTEAFVGEDDLPLRSLKNPSRNRCQKFVSGKNTSQISARTFFGGLFDVVSGAVAYIDSRTGTNVRQLRIPSWAPHDHSSDSASHTQKSILRVTSFGRKRYKRFVACLNLLLRSLNLFLRNLQLREGLAVLLRGVNPVPNEDR